MKHQHYLNAALRPDLRALAHMLNHCPRHQRLERLYTHAVEQDDVPLVAVLLDSGIPVDRVTGRRSGAARAARSAAMLALLLARGARADARCARNDTALHAAVRLNSMAMVRVLLPALDVDARNDFGSTPLHYAAAAPAARRAAAATNADIIRALLARAADVNAADRNGRTPLDKARTRKAHPGAIEVLRDAGARSRFELKGVK